MLAVLMTALSQTGCPKKVTSNDLQRSETHLNLAREAFGRTPPNLDEAKAEATKAIGFMSNNEDAYNVRGMVHLYRYLLAKYAMESSACLTGLDSEAQQAEMDQELLLAAPDFKRATEIAPDFAEAWFNRGNVASAQGDYEMAVEMFTRSLENPIRLVDATKARANLGSAYLELGDAVSAAKELRQALQFSPNFCLGKLWLGRVYFTREEWDKAGELFAGIVDDPTCRSIQEAPLYLMQTRIRQGLTDEARAAKQACLGVSRVSCIALQCASEGASL